MEPRQKWKKIILAGKIIYFISDVVPCWNKIISDPSRRRRSTVLKLFYFTRGSNMKWNKIILAELRPWAEFRARSVAQAPVGAWKFPSFAYRRRPAAAWRLQSTNAATGCNTASWIFMLNYFISFQTWFHVKTKFFKFFKIILFHFRRGSMLKWNTETP